MTKGIQPASSPGDQKIAIIKYNAGNIQSVLYALERIGVDAVVTDQHDQISQADKVIFPGVGEASTAMKYLKERELDKLIKVLSQPVLGICLGMQLMCTFSEENDTVCLGIFDERVSRFSRGNAGAEKVPQVGWNTICQLNSDLFNAVPENSYCYFVHSYAAGIGKHTVAVTDYIQPYSAALQKNNFFGVQFHPEKSAGTGERILMNFLKM